MIVSIRGILQRKSANVALIECGGLGYEVQVPLTVTERLPAEGAEVFLLTELVIRENSHSLYGFLQERERLLFQQLMKTSGVGAKTVLAMMSTMTLDDLVNALSADDVGRLCAIPGIGRKTAERLIVDFRGSALLLESAAAVSETDREVEQALAALGYSKGEIKKVVSQLTPEAGDDTAARVRAALRLLSGR